MAIVKINTVVSTPTKTLKVEGTSQTYGQLVTIVGAATSSPTPVVPSKGAIAPQDIAVKTTVTTATAPTAASATSLDASKTLTVASIASTAGVASLTADIAKAAIVAAALQDATVPVASVVDASVDKANIAAGTNTVSSVIESLVTNKNDISIGAAVDLAALPVATTKQNILAIVAGSSLKTKDELKKVILEAQKINLAITLKSKRTESLEFNLLKSPQLSAKYVYNFYTESETDVVEQEDQTKDPLLTNNPNSVPRYIELQWNVSKTTENVAGTEESVRKNTNLKRDIFSRKRGVVSGASRLFKDSLDKSKKLFNPINQDGMSKQITDIQGVEKGFDSLSNDAVFSNTVQTVFNVSDAQKNQMPISGNIVLPTNNLSGVPFIRVNFTNRGFSKILKGNPASLHDKTPDKSTVLSIAQFLGELKTEKGTPIVFQSIPELLGIDYVGYIIDKERFDKKNNRWIRIDEYKIVGSDANSFKDSRVAYGNLYRYRIKSVVKVTLEKIKEIEVDVIPVSRSTVEKTVLESQKPAIEQAQSFAVNGLKPTTSSGSPPVTKFNFGGNVSIVASSTGIKSVIDAAPSSNLIGSQVLSLLKNQKIKQQVKSYESFYFESYIGKNWIYMQTLDLNPPLYPTAIKIIPNSSQKQVLISWLKPSDSRQHIAHFRLYRRNAIGKQWTLLSELQESVGFYIDKRVDFNAKYIYAITSIDIHGIESFLSTQIQAELNPKFEIEQREKNLRWISGGGVDLDEKNVVLRKFRDTELPIVLKEGFTIKPVSTFNDTQRDLIIRVTSLDTHEQKEFRIRLVNENIRAEDRNK